MDGATFRMDSACAAEEVGGEGLLEGWAAVAVAVAVAAVAAALLLGPPIPFDV